MNTINKLKEDMDNQIKKIHKAQEKSLKSYYSSKNPIDWYRVTLVEDRSFISPYTKTYGLGLTPKHKLHYLKSLWFLFKNYKRIKGRL